MVFVIDGIIAGVTTVFHGDDVILLLLVVPCEQKQDGSQNNVAISVAYHKEIFRYVFLSDFLLYRDSKTDFFSFKLQVIRQTEQQNSVSYLLLNCSKNVTYLMNCYAYE